MTEGFTFGKTATDQIVKTVREHSRRQQYQTPQRARWLSRPSVSTTTITNAAGACGCGNVYSRGTQTLTVSATDFEAATTYTATPNCAYASWPYPELTWASSNTWETPDSSLSTCYGGTSDYKLRMTPCVLTTVCTDITLIGMRIDLVSVANDCSLDPEPAATWYCDAFNQLGPTSEFKLVASSIAGVSTFEPPPILCVSPKAGGCSLVSADWGLTDTVIVRISGTIGANPYDEEFICPIDPSPTGLSNCEQNTCAYAGVACATPGFEGGVLVYLVSDCAETSVPASTLTAEVLIYNPSCLYAANIGWNGSDTGGPHAVASIDCGNQTFGAPGFGYNLDCVVSIGAV